MREKNNPPPRFVKPPTNALLPVLLLWYIQLPQPPHGRDRKEKRGPAMSSFVIVARSHRGNGKRRRGGEGLDGRMLRMEGWRGRGATAGGEFAN